MTAEHIWPSWFRKYVPRELTSPKKALHTTGRSWIDANGQRHSTLTTQGKLARSGEIADQKLRIVCGTCNGGWMSRLQNAAKPILAPCIKGDWSKPMNDEEQAIIAAWATMFTMVLERADPNTIATSQTDRTALMQSSKALPDWWIFVGRSGGLKAKFLHRAVGIEGPGWSQADHPDTHNTHVTTFVAGALLLQTLSSQVRFFSNPAKFAAQPYVNAMGFAQIWPPQSSTVGRPPRLSTDQDFVLTASVLPLKLFGPSSLDEAIALGRFDPTATGRV
jgi:hypothetical protein